MPQRILTALALIASLAMVALAGAQPTRAYHEGDGTQHPFADPAFEATWNRTDATVTPNGDATWLWGPSPYTEGMQEEYAEAPGGQRLVQYFDKSRMEINNPDGDTESVWFVTNGLLVVEMVEGWYQTGDATFDETPDPAAINIAGDPAGDEGFGPTYADIAEFGLRAEPAAEVGDALINRIDSEGNITADEDLAAHDVSAVERVDVTSIDHTVASVFWNRMVQIGADYDDNAFYVTGLPITEAYWSEVSVGGTQQDVLWQCFERRCLTYTPGNAAQWQVEMGNVGQHYYAWRYGDDSGEEPTPPTEPQTVHADLGALNDSGVTGTADLTLDGNTLTVSIVADGLTANDIHAMHLHGFNDGTAAACPTDEADTNEDGIISMDEAVVVTGGAVFPFTPFPSADDDGTATLTETYTLTDDQVAQLTDLSSMAVMVHGGMVDDDFVDDLPIACGDLDVASEEPGPDPEPEPEPTVAYASVLDAVNGSEVSATAELSIDGNSLTVTIEAEGLTPNLAHAMHIYGMDDGAASCPVDLDEDGFIDVEEGTAAYGESIVALTTDETDTSFPAAGEDGTLSYSATFDLTDAQLDQLADPTQTVVVIHGLMIDLDGDGELPSSYAAAIPAACGAVEAVYTGEPGV
ncbi:MAG: superoxide dismutase family protein [Thermomicrobiales bacterium]|nr:superoxide dismutase family protein [Thermomicrobiales bacterium]